MSRKNQFTHACYKTKDDKRHATAFFIGGIETEEDRAARLERLHKWKIEKDKQKEVAEESNAPRVSFWQKEWTRLATGMCLSKSQLKAYCKAKGKVIIN